VVLDCTGVYGNREHREPHLNAGAKKLLFSHPRTHHLDATVVFCVNKDQLPASHPQVCHRSSSTNIIITWYYKKIRRPDNPYPNSSFGKCVLKEAGGGGGG
ncbi:hypothetical protein ACVGWC_05990, partial [Enterobacter hormaechei]